MQLVRLQKEIQKLGGTVTMKMEDTKYGGTHTELIAELNGYDVHAHSNGADSLECTYYTIRRIKDRGHYDIGNDYNPGGYIYLDKIKSLKSYIF